MWLETILDYSRSGVSFHQICPRISTSVFTSIVKKGLKQCDILKMKQNSLMNKEQKSWCKSLWTVVSSFGWKEKAVEKTFSISLTKSIKTSTGDNGRNWVLFVNSSIEFSFDTCYLSLICKKHRKNHVAAKMPVIVFET